MTAASGTSVSRRVTIVNGRGLHARAAAKFVKLAGTFDAEIIVARNEIEVSGSSIMGLMMLGAAPGCELELRASGLAAEAALEALSGLIANRFDEEI
ncbi:MAG TPA: HPr family phosphocarrier protein [Kiloniellales bacterium]